MNQNNCIRLSIYLAKEDVDFEDLLKTEYISDCNELKPSAVQRIYYKDNVIKIPNYISTFFNAVDLEKKLFSSSLSIVYLEKVKIDDKKRIFAIPFGYGHNFLELDNFISDFGLKVVFNSCKSNSIRRITKIEIGKNYKKSNEQLPTQNNIKYFGVSPEDDLIQDITAKCKFEDFEGNITGKANVCLSYNLSMSNCTDFLKKLYSVYIQDTYKDNFGFIDQIKLVKNNKIINDLDNKIIQTFESLNFNRDKVYLAIPEIINWEKVDYIKYPYQKNRKENKHDDIEINEFLEDFDEKRTKNLLNSNFEIIFENYSKSYKFKKCLIAEVEFNDEVYCLVNGTYFKVQKSYKNFIEEFYDSHINVSTNCGFLQECNEKNEGDYNKKHASDDVIVLDCQIVHNGFTVEPCDLLTSSKQIIHVKKYYGASAMSHLFNQGVVSAELLLNDEKFKKEVNQKIKDSENKNKEKFLFDEVSFKSEDYEIVFAIINNQGLKKPNISFFSKIALKNAFSLIEKTYRYKCTIYGVKNNHK